MYHTVMKIEMEFMLPTTHGSQVQKMRLQSLPFSLPLTLLNMLCGLGKKITPKSGLICCKFTSQLEISRLSKQISKLSKSKWGVSKSCGGCLTFNLLTPLPFCIKPNQNQEDSYTLQTNNLVAKVD